MEDINVLGKRKQPEKAKTEVTLTSKTSRIEGINNEKYHTDPAFLVSLIYTRAEQLRVPDNTVFIAERTDKVIDVFKGLVKHNFLSVPVLQKTGQKWYGFIDISDIVTYVVHNFNLPMLSTTEDFWALFDKEEEFRKKTVKDLMKGPLSRNNPFHPVRGGYSLLYAMEALAKEPNLHRVVVIDDQRQILNLITQSQVVRFLSEHLTELGPKADCPVSQLKSVIKPVFSVNKDIKAIEAFEYMIEKGVAGVAVVNDEGKLIGNISLIDLKAMAPDGSLFWRLFHNVSGFLHKVDEHYGQKRPSRVQYCSPKQTFKEAITRMVEQNIHRMYVVDDEHKPIGVISSKDVLFNIIN